MPDDSFDEPPDPAEAVPLEWLLGGRKSGYFQSQRYASLSGSCRYEPTTKTAAQQALNRVQRSAVASGVLLRQEFAKDMGRKGVKLSDLITGNPTVVENPDLASIPRDRNQQWNPRGSNKSLKIAGQQAMRAKVLNGSGKGAKEMDVSHGYAIKRQFMGGPMVQPMEPQPRVRVREGGEKHVDTACVRGVNTVMDQDMESFNNREDFKFKNHPQKISESVVDMPNNITMIRKKQVGLMLKEKEMKTKEAKEDHAMQLERMARFKHQEANEKFKTVASKRFMSELSKQRNPKERYRHRLETTRQPTTFTIPSANRGSESFNNEDDTYSWEQQEDSLTAPLVVAPDSVEPDRVGWKLPRTQSDGFHLNRTDVFVFGGGFNAG
jgi:hypothetical protein